MYRTEEKFIELDILPLTKQHTFNKCSISSVAMREDVLAGTLDQIAYGGIQKFAFWQSVGAKTAHHPFRNDTVLHTRKEKLAMRAVSSGFIPKPGQEE